MARRYASAERQAASRDHGSPWPPGFAAGPTIGQVFDRYHREFGHRRREYAYITAKNLELLLRVNAMEESWPISALTKEQCLVLKKSLLEGTATPRGRKKPGPVTIAGNLDHVRRFTKWCVENDILPKDPMQGVTIPPRLVSAAKLHKESFTDQELTRILGAVFTYAGSPDPMRREWVWIVYLLAGTGARCGEILQLRRDDLTEVDGVHCIKITDEGSGQLLKNRQSRRVVPIHSAILKAGFWAWAQSQGEELFPKLRPYHAQKVSAWFRHAARSVGVQSRTKTLHSLRHTVAVRLERARVHFSVMRRLLGHAVGSSVEDRVYLGSLTHSAGELREAIEKLSLPPLPG
jgi:integrase